VGNIYIFLFIADDRDARELHIMPKTRENRFARACVDNAGRRDSDRHFQTHTLGKFQAALHFPDRSNQQSLEMEMFTSSCGSFFKLIFVAPERVQTT
jgi:hypothetical protein